MPPWNRKHFKLRPAFVWKFRIKAFRHRWLSTLRKPGIDVQPFLVTGPPRSGTSLLTALLTRKPNVLVVNEPIVVSDLTFVEYDPAELLKGYFNHTARRAVTRGLLKTKVDPDHPHHSTTDTANRGYARNDVPVRIDPTRPLAIGVKHPQTFMEFMQEICDAWPELRIVCAVRDPGPTIRSWRETRFGWDPQIDDPSQGIWRRYYELIPIEVTDPLEKRAHVWRILAERSLEFSEKYPGRVMISRYEDLVRNPAESLARIFRHIGTDHPEESVDTSDVQHQDRPNYRGFTESEAAMIERICASVNSRIHSG